MNVIDARNLNYDEVNEKIRETKGDCRIDGCLGQRFIAAGMKERNIKINGIPGNAMGAYLNGAHIEVMDNAQDAVGDTMNEGLIKIHGNIGDAAGYAMRGGAIYVKGNAGYRAGIHMKAYKTKKPVMVIGGRTGSFLGEYQAGGYIVVLGLHKDGKPIVGNFPCTGMHGGKMFLRSNGEGLKFPKQVNVETASKEDLEEVKDFIRNYCEFFGEDYEAVMKDEFIKITPDTRNPYKQMYVAN